MVEKYIRKAEYVFFSDWFVDVLMCCSYLLCPS